jgi:ectoine hydroxylase-related dioxygenase (phytanoyl-CoA dioxygenase family)
MKGNNQSTAEHTDYYYFKQASRVFSMREKQTPTPTLIQCDLCDKIIDSKSYLSNQVGGDEVHCSACANQSYDYWTCWIAMSDIQLKDGCLAVVPSTHKLQGYEKANQLLPQQFLKQKRSKTIWRAPESMQAGDVILFNVKTVHGASKNTSGYYRYSCDTRVTTQHTHHTLAQESKETARKRLKFQ